MSFRSSNRKSDRGRREADGDQNNTDQLTLRLGVLESNSLPSQVPSVQLSSHTYTTISPCIEQPDIILEYEDDYQITLRLQYVCK